MTLNKKPLIIAHRGSSATEPENTMRAFRAAKKFNSDGIELDIYQTQDHKLVVTHDQNTLRLTGENFNVSKSTYKDLEKLDFGKKETIPLLENVLEEFLTQFKVINIEIKSTGLLNTGLELNLARLLASIKKHNNLVISSFNPINLWRLKKHFSKTKLGYLITPKQNPIIKSTYLIKKSNPYSIHLDYKQLDKSKLNTLMGLGYKNWLWTIDKTHDMVSIVKNSNVDAIITNNPKHLYDVINKKSES